MATDLDPSDPGISLVPLTATHLLIHLCVLTEHPLTSEEIPLDCVSPANHQLSPAHS